MSSALKVLFLASEADPFVKIGGLADVAGSLPPALINLPPEINPQGIDIRLVLPFYHIIDRSDLDLLKVANFSVSHKDGPIQTEAYLTESNGLKVYLIDAPIIPTEGAIYHNDAGLDGPKFTFFSLAALELARKLNWRPDILHAQDWHTSPAIYALNFLRPNDGFFQDTASLLTVHNLPYLGIGTSQALTDFDLPPAHGSQLPYWAQQLPLPLGLLTADHINTVSPGYAGEILTPEFGSGLEGFLKTRSNTISGILNGIDLDQWNPAIDPHLETNFQLKNLPQRYANKKALLEEINLKPDPRGDVPLLAMINRMDYQKGVDLVPDALREIAGQPWQAIILGTGDTEIESAAQLLEQDFPDRIRVAIRFDGGLARRIYAGSDALLIPSRYEPCGLTQMIAMRYGCVPIARSTGGLKDTIRDYHQKKNSTGFLFQEATSSALSGAIRRGLETYADKRRWRGLQIRGMKSDFSWQGSAKQYLALYNYMVTKRRSRKKAIL
jgi:starch synthase